MKRSLLLACGVLTLLASSRASADVKMPAVFASHMVVQRDMPLPVWGWADAGEAVTVFFGGQTASAKADDNGKWKVTLPKFKANATGQTLTVKGNNTVELTDVLVGEVWIGSGQSNMEWSVAASANPQKTIAAANHPTIRLLHVKKFAPNAPAKDVQLEKPHGAWTACTPKTIPNFSAVLYFFGVRIQKELDVPVGLINSSWGGSAIQPWTVEDKGSGGMYNGMIAPLLPVAVRGVLWYQGESNMSEGMVYHGRKEKLIKGWRKVFGQDDMPFLFVQIAPFSGYGKNSLPNLWEAQAATLKVPNTGMVVVTDLVDNVGDIHPKNKLDVGNRLALWAWPRPMARKTSSTPGRSTSR